jgi:hypothetical protein
VGVLLRQPATAGSTAAAGPGPAAARPAAAPGPAPAGGGAPSAEPAAPSGVIGRLLRQASEWARRIPGYDLLGVVLGRDPLSSQPVERSAAAIVRGVAGLIPGGAAMVANLERAGAVARAGAWLEEQWPRLGLTWTAIVELFSRAVGSLSPMDIFRPIAAIERVVGYFAAPIGRLMAFARGAVGKLAELVFEGVLSLAGSLGGQIMGVLRRAGDVLRRIFDDPIGFAGNLIAAVRGGLARFMENIGAHLRTGLFSWLLGALRGALTLPARFDFAGILSLVLQVLGLTWSAIRGRLVALIGEERMQWVENAVGFVKTLVTEGLAGAWRQIMEWAGNLADTVLGGIRDWVSRSVVGAAITRLITLFNPAGALIQAILGIYNTIRFFIERAQQLGALATSLFDSIAAIASGNLGNAIAAVENAMARTLPVVLGFLARLLGLGDIATPIRNVIARLRAPIDQALDRLIDWVKGMAQRAMAAVRGAPRDEAAPDTPETAAVKEAAQSRVRARVGGLSSFAQLHAVLEEVREEFRPQGVRSISIGPEADGGQARLEVTASPPTAAMLQWRDIFAPDALASDEVERLEAIFAGQGPPESRDETYAAVSVDGQLIGSTVSAEEHAEFELVNSGRWEDAIGRASALAGGGKTAEVILMVNRTPCHTLCTNTLLGEIQRRRRAKEEDRLPNGVKFILAATHPYEQRGKDLVRAAALRKAAEDFAQQGIPPDVAKKALRKMAEKYGVLGLGPDTTRLNDLRRLAANGWDIRALNVQLGPERPPKAGTQLLEATVLRIRDELKRGALDALVEESRDT